MPTRAPIDWEAFYRDYRKPGYVSGFEILEKIGGGAFGLVFKARKQSIRKDYAIKFLKVDDEAVRDAVVAELDAVRLFAQIDHPNLVSIEDKGEVDGIPFIVMGYAGDTTLRQRLADGALPREEALKLFGQIARGVGALHARALVHFDLKPANVFLRGDLVRVGDYGLSRLVTGTRNSLTFGRGTPYYMAPELLRRKGDHRSDIYSLGVLLFECLCGDVPFKGDSEWEVLKKHESEAPPIPARLSEPEASVLRTCLQKRPEDRYQNVAEVLTALFGKAEAVALSPTPPPAPPIGSAPSEAPAAGGHPERAWPGRTPRRRCRTKRRLAMLAAAVVAMAMFATARTHGRVTRPPTSFVYSMSAPQAPVLVDANHPVAIANVQAPMAPAPIAMPNDELRVRLSALWRTALPSLAHALDAPGLAETRARVQEVRQRLQAELRRNDLRGLETTLDDIGNVIERLLLDLEQRQ